MYWAKTLTIICAITATLAAFQYINLMSLYKDHVEWGSFMVTQSTDVSEAKKKEVLALSVKTKLQLLALKERRQFYLFPPVPGWSYLDTFGYLGNLHSWINTHRSPTGRYAEEFVNTTPSLPFPIQSLGGAGGKPHLVKYHYVEYTRNMR